MAIYKVVHGVTVRMEGGQDEAHQTVRLIDAANKAQAIAHVVRDSISCEVCEVADAVKLGAEGVQIETAGEVAT